MPKRAISTPMFIKVTGVSEFNRDKVLEFLARDEIKSRQPIFAGEENLGRLPFIELADSNFNLEYGTYTLNFRVHPFFWSWKTDPEQAVKRECSLGIIDDFFYLNFDYFENPR